MNLKVELSETDIETVKFGGVFHHFNSMFERNQPPVHVKEIL